MTRKAPFRLGLTLLAALIIVAMLMPSAAFAAQKIHVVKRGENLTRIAMRYGTSVRAIMNANGIRNANYIYTGQRLKIPGTSGGTSGGSSGGATKVHVVKRGENVSMIARRYGTSVASIVRLNNLRNANLIYVGQRLKVSGSGGGGTVKKNNTGGGSGGGAAPGVKWIDIDLSSQTLRAMKGNTAVRRMRVSTGTSRYPTPVGTYRVYAKYRAVRMTGCCPKYNLPNVPWTMFYHRGYAIHGTYWHNNFGTRMSHGCVNLRTSDARWLYAWSPRGIRVKVHR